VFRSTTEPGNFIDDDCGLLWHPATRGVKGLIQNRSHPGPISLLCKISFSSFLHSIPSAVQVLACVSWCKFEPLVLIVCGGCASNNAFGHEHFLQLPSPGPLRRRWSTCPLLKLQRSSIIKSPWLDHVPSAATVSSAFTSPSLHHVHTSSLSPPQRSQCLRPFMCAPPPLQTYTQLSAPQRFLWHSLSDGHLIISASGNDTTRV
jgi:hypothetical protein